MRLRTILNLLLFLFITASLALATGIASLGPMMSSAALIDPVIAENSNGSSQPSSDIPLLGDAVSITGSVLLASPKPGSTESIDDPADQLTSGFTAAELAPDAPERPMNFLWLFGFSGLLAAVASARMIKYNKRSNEVVGTGRKCSSCFSTKTLTSRWRWYELPLWLFAARPIRCFTCQRRQFAWAWARKQSAEKPAQHLVPAQ